MKILLINSDLAKNRGDRAITEGIVKLIKELYPDAQITGLSEHSGRDSQWFGINFLNMDAQSLHMLDLIKLLREARASDVVLWGGGELLKDYTNKFALYYWVCKMWLVIKVNRNTYGAYQGIGPTRAALSRYMIRFIVSRCRHFIVRDKESYQKLISWGCDSEKISHAGDPAVLPHAQKLGSASRKLLRDEFNIDDAFLKDFTLVGPRNWFHYKQGGLLPYRYRKNIPFHPTKKSTSNKKRDIYLESLVELCETILRKGGNILFVPMHMGEEDIAVCRYIKDNISDPSLVRILDRDIISPAELRSIMSHARAMVGFRLHSTIIATSGHVPCINYYYVDKGRVYFDQIGQSENAFPVEDLLDQNFARSFNKAFNTLLSNRGSNSRIISKRLGPIRETIRSNFKKMMDMNQ